MVSGADTGVPTFYRRSPLKFLITLLALVFLAETAVMFVLPQLFPRGLGEIAEALVDASLLTLFTSPIVWLLLIRPLRSETYRLANLNARLSEEITARSALEEKLKHMASHDNLTGLANRALFLKHLERALARKKHRPNYLFAILFIDLDGFKAVNDSLGHVAGDLLLVQVGKRLEAVLRACDTIARLGGDEFAVLLDDAEEAAGAAKVAQRLIETLSGPFSLDDLHPQGGARHQQVCISASIGIVGGGTDSGTAEQLLAQADIAMYRAKLKGKSGFELFDPKMHTRAVERLRLESALQRAVQSIECDQVQFFLNYQPIVSLENGRLLGFEALLRWNHPEKGLVLPNEFIPLAEETRLILPLGMWVLREACRQMSEWLRQIPGTNSKAARNISVSVNTSGKQLQQPDFVSQVEGVLCKADLAPRHLKLEITESVAMQNIESTAAVLKGLRALGVELSIDDFGRGYSCLTYLHELPINNLKIDRYFVSRLSCDDRSSQIVDTIAKLAHNLGMNVVAEGVETVEQRDILQRIGCECAQGFLFSRPVGSDKVRELLEAEFDVMRAKSVAR